jgi:hypothetical protein
VNLPTMQVPYGMVSAGVPTAATLAWKQPTTSPVMFNTVRRMTDTNLTILPLSRITFRVGYSQNIFQGPSLTPGRSVGKYDNLLDEYQRNSSDDFHGRGRLEAFYAHQADLRRAGRPLQGGLVLHAGSNYAHRAGGKWDAGFFGQL